MNTTNWDNVNPKMVQKAYSHYRGLTNDERKAFKFLMDMHEEEPVRG